MVRGLANDDRAGRGDVLEPRRGVHHVARHALADLRALAERDHRLAGVDPDADRELQPRLLPVRLLDIVQDLEAGPDRALGVVLVAHRGSEDAEDRVADELVDRAAEVLDRAFQQRVIHAKHRLDVLGVGLIRALREPDQVAEQDRDDFAFLARGHTLKGRPAVQTEPRALRILGPAPGADDHGAECSDGSVQGPATTRTAVPPGRKHRVSAYWEEVGVRLVVSRRQDALMEVLSEPRPSSRAGYLLVLLVPSLSL